MLFQLLLLPASVAGLTCYCKDSVYGLHDGCPKSQPCYHAASGVQQCCAAGDLCGDDGFCKFGHSGIPLSSGYYRGGCTDPTFTDPACPQQCTKHRTLDVAFNATTGLWACCYNGSDTLDCGKPGSDAFQARPPDQLNFRAASTATPAAASSNPAAPASSSSATAVAGASDTPGSASQLSVGAKAGIGVGVGVAGLALLMALAFLFVRRRKTESRGTRDKPDARMGVYRMGEITKHDRQLGTLDEGR